MQFLQLNALTLLLTCLVTSVFSAAQTFPDFNLPKGDKESAYVSIQRTLYLFSIAVDTKDYDLFDNIFTPDITANFTLPGTTAITSLSQLKSSLGGLLKGLISQHSLSNLIVDFTSPTTANATQYLVGSFLGQGNLTGEVYTNYGKYVDTLELQSSGGWLVSHRQLVNIVSCTSLLRKREETGRTNGRSLGRGRE